MFLGAIVDAGVASTDIATALKGLSVKGYEIVEEKVRRSSIQATKITVRIKDASRVTRRWKDILKIIKQSKLPEPVKERGFRVFKGLFEAEGKIHGIPADRVHLHELGAIDCLVDIFGTLMGLHLLGIEKVYASSVNLGRGLIRTEHGTIPVPSPAVVELLKNKPVYSSGPEFELTTPTGAAILRETVCSFGPMPPMRIAEIGYGAGTMDFGDFPNILRLITGEEREKNSSDDVFVIETNIDDMNPQIYEYLLERLFEAGAIDVFLTQVIMKKGRPGILLTVLSGEDKRERLTDIIFKETTTLGVRFYRTKRITLDREIREGYYGSEKVRLKIARPGKVERANPEYEDCKRIAKKKGIPLIDVMRVVKRDGETS